MSSMPAILPTALPAPPRPVLPIGGSRRWSAADVEREAERLEAAIKQPLRWGRDMCRMIAPMTLEVNRLKRERDAIILAHSYQTPDIVYGVADEVGDSYGLSKKAMAAPQSTIVFSSVRFMGETAKILNPQKTVLLPEPTAGCSLSDSITAADVRRLRERHPGVPVMCYVNTSAEVKAECDVTCTSANYLAIARKLPGRELVFVPDRYMGAHLQRELAGEKTVHTYNGECEVHVQFSAESAQAWRAQAAAEGRKLVILAHPECDPKVLAEADFVGSTEKMMDYARRLEAEGRVDVMPITECGTADRMRAELPSLNIYGACVQCPHMKKSTLASILQVLEAPRPEQAVQIAPGVVARARRSLDEMFRLGG